MNDMVITLMSVAMRDANLPAVHANERASRRLMSVRVNIPGLYYAVTRTQIKEDYPQDV